MFDKCAFQASSQQAGTSGARARGEPQPELYRAGDSRYQAAPAVDFDFSGMLFHVDSCCLPDVHLADGHEPQDVGDDDALAWKEGTANLYLDDVASTIYPEVPSRTADWSFTEYTSDLSSNFEDITSDFGLLGFTHGCSVWDDLFAEHADHV